MDKARLKEFKEEGYECDVAICLDTINYVKLFYVGGYEVVVPVAKLRELAAAFVD